MTTKETILELLKDQGSLSAGELADNLMLSRQMIHLALRELTDMGLIQRIGKPPKTVYQLKAESRLIEVALPSAQEEFLKKNFILITETGEMKEGPQGFQLWCAQHKLPFEKTVNEYISTNQKYQAYFNANGFIDGMEKLKGTKGYEAIHLDSLYYLDFYAIERFGKTRLGTILHYAKQGQSKLLMKLLVNETKAKVEELCRIINADGVGFVPPTIRREVQLMKYLQTHYGLNLPLVKINKTSGIIPVPQKSLGKLEERITNAQQTFSIPEPRKFNHVLLIDDAVGSGATVNEISGKLKKKGVAERVSALAITGSFKGFDVITDV
ncbi:MAG: winged helix-turn-helix transcriptional regulator [Cyclobacteriaceae bacterium]|nr:winged helix-turn-helix transcriptional regulator [Cyclobacteriaceae bacterium]